MRNTSSVDQETLRARDRDSGSTTRFSPSPLAMHPLFIALLVIVSVGIATAIGVLGRRWLLGVMDLVSTKLGRPLAWRIAEPPIAFVACLVLEVESQMLSVLTVFLFFGAVGCAGHDAYRATRRRRFVDGLRSLPLLVAVVASSALGIVIHRVQIHATKEAGDRVANALSDYRAEQHTYPESLQDLVPAHLDRIPDNEVGGLSWQASGFRYQSDRGTYQLSFPSRLMVEHFRGPDGRWHSAD